MADNKAKKQEGEINLFDKVKIVGLEHSDKKVVNHLKKDVEYTVHPELAKTLVKKGVAKYPDGEPKVTQEIPEELSDAKPEPAK